MPDHQPKKGAGFCHIEIPAPDLDKSVRFYQNVFNWKEVIFEGFEGYWFFSTENIGGALVKHIKPCSYGVIQEGKKELTDYRGYYAYFSDPNGNTLGIWSEK
ncbi:MAG: VOC family protein [bacterium]